MSLPLPPAGYFWHTSSRYEWSEDDLPTGYRPLLLGEERQAGDEMYSNGWRPTICIGGIASAWHEPCRTTRPLPDLQS